MTYISYRATERLKKSFHSLSLEREFDWTKMRKEEQKLFLGHTVRNARYCRSNSSIKMSLSKNGL